MSDFYKLNKKLKLTLNQALKIENYNEAITDKEFERENIEKLIELGYLREIGKAQSTTNWGCFILPTYNGLHYKELERKHNKYIIGEWIKFFVPVFLSIVTLIISILEK